MINIIVVSRTNKGLAIQPSDALGKCSSGMCPMGMPKPGNCVREVSIFDLTTVDIAEETGDEIKEQIAQS